MRAIWITRSGGPEVLEVRETADPVAGPGQVRVRAHACGLNFAELSARQGIYPDAPKPPFVAGYEGAGIVDQVGEGVTSVAAGDRVLYLSRFGGHADTVVVPASNAFPMPAEMSFEEAAAIPVNYLTAYHSLFQVARVRSGDRVLVHMAAGGVGTAAIQLLRGTGVIGFGTASKGKHDYVREQGCQHPIDYRSEDYVQRVRELTSGEGVDYILDALGGADWAKGYGLLREGGMLICFGAANASQPGGRSVLRLAKLVWGMPSFRPFKLMNDNRGVAGVNMGAMWHRADMLGEHMKQIMALYASGQVKPHIDSVHSFAKAKDGFARLEMGKNQGKVIFTPN